MRTKGGLASAYQAEMNNLLTEANLKRMFGSDLKRVNRFMKARYITLKMRLCIPLTIQEEWDVCAVFDDPSARRVFAGVNLVTNHPWPNFTRDTAKVEYDRLCGRLSDAIADSDYAQQCRRESDDARRSAYRSLTGDNRFNQW